MDFIDKALAQYDVDVTEATIPTIYNNTESILYPAPHQEMLELYTSFSEHDRMLAVWSTGSGKTIGSLRVAKRFIDETAKKTALKPENVAAILATGNSVNASKPSGVKIIGFTDEIFIKELVSFPDLGVVSFDDVERTKWLDTNGTIEEMHKHYLYLRHKTKDREQGGFYEFFGNKELFQQLFVDIETNKAPVVKSYADLNRQIAEKKVSVQKLLDNFRDSFLICDEIHNVYNKKDNNSWGLALSYILDNTNAKALFISATPISNSQNEIVSVVNLLAGKGRKYNTEDFFDGSSGGGGSLTAKGRSIILKETKGKISYLKNTNIEDFPRWAWMGKEVAGIPNMKFVKVPISQEHLQLYKAPVAINSIENEEAYPEEGVGESSIGFRNDFYLKSAQGNIVGSVSELSAYSKTKPRVQSREAYDDGKLDQFYYDSDIGIGLEETFDVQTFAPKYWKMLQDLTSSTGKKTGKSIIYHNNVKNNGIFFISQILDLYGFTKYGSAPQPHAICFNCGELKEQHSAKIHTLLVKNQQELDNAISTKSAAFLKIFKNNTESKNAFGGTGGASRGDSDFSKLVVPKKLGHPIEATDDFLIYALDPDDSLCFNFSPRRYVMIWSDPEVHVGKILKVYNSAENATGVNVEIVLGSKKIKESLDFKAVRRVLVMARPPSISTLIQIIGRAIRNKSHNQLPKNNRVVDIFVYVHYHSSRDLDEIVSYKDRMDQFLKFRKLEELLYVDSINAFTYPDTNENTYKNILDTYTLEKKRIAKVAGPIPGLDGDKRLILATDKKRFDLLYTKMEIDKIKQIIKSLFIEQPLWEYNNLVNAIFNWSTKHQWNTNTMYIERNNIDASLAELLYTRDTSFIDVDNEKFTTTFRSINSTRKTIVLDGREYNIIPFTVTEANHNTEAVQYFKLQRIDTLQELTPLTMFTDTSSKPTELEYVEFSIPLSSLMTQFDPVSFLADTTLDSVVGDVDGLLDQEQVNLIVYIVNELGLFSSKPKKIAKAILQKATRSIFFLIFTGLFVVKKTGSLGGSVDIMLNNMTNNIFNIKAGEMNTINRLPMQYHPVSAAVEKVVLKEGTFFGLLEPIKIQRRKPIVYRDGRMEESHYVENVKYKENNVVIGYMERDGKVGKKLFKLREPNHAASSKADTRTINKGSYYMNIQRPRLEKYIMDLDPSHPDLSAFTKKTDLGAYLKYLLRQLDKNSTDGTRYFYW